MDDMERTQQFSRTIPCPYCGEEYSITYKSCPFCDGGNSGKKSDSRKKAKTKKPEKRRKPERKPGRNSQYEEQPERRGRPEVEAEPEFIEIQEIPRKKAPRVEEKEEPVREPTAAEKLLELEALIESIKADESIGLQEEVSLEGEDLNTATSEEDAAEEIKQTEDLTWEEEEEETTQQPGEPFKEEAGATEPAGQEELPEETVEEESAFAEEEPEEAVPSLDEDLHEAKRLLSEGVPAKEAKEVEPALEEELVLEHKEAPIEETILEVPPEEMERLLSGEEDLPESPAEHPAEATEQQEEQEEQIEKQEDAAPKEAVDRTEQTQEETLEETTPDKESAVEMDKSQSEGKVSAAPTPSGGGKRLQKKPFGPGRVLLILLSLAIIAAAVYIVVTQVVPIIQSRFGEESSQSADSGTVAFGLNETTVTLTEVGETKQLSVKAGSPGETEVTWESSDAEVATVSDEGLVTAVAAGSAKITASNADGQTAQCEVLCVLEDAEEETEGSTASGEVYLNKTDFTLYQGQSFEMKAVGTDQTPVWTSDKPTVATVSESGVVQFVGEGTANITAEVGEETLSAIVRCIGRAAP